MGLVHPKFTLTMPAAEVSGDGTVGSVITIDNIANFSLAVGQTRDMSQYINDPNAVQTGSSMKGVTEGILSDGRCSYSQTTELLTANSAGTENNCDLTVTGGVEDAVSNTFTVTVTSNMWLGEGLTGEFGAIATNDNWSTTVYEYERQYAPTLPTLPTPTTGAALPTSSGVNPNASDEYMVFDIAGFRAAMNNSAYDKIFIAKGTDLYDAIGVTEIITQSGTAQNPRWFIYWNDDTNDTSDPRPWDLAQADRAYGPYLIRCRASYCYFVGLSFGIYGVRSQRAIGFSSGASNCIVYRCYSTYGGKQSESAFSTFNCDDESGNECGDNNIFFEIVSEANYVDITNNNEYDTITLQSGNDHKIISCQLSDPCNANIQLGPGNIFTGIIIEDCDLFKDKRYDSDATGVDDTNPNGLYSQGDSCAGMKRTIDSGAGPHVRVIGNRFWGARPTSGGLDSTPSSGWAWAFSNDRHMERVELRYNVFFDCTRGAIQPATNNNGDGEAPGSNHTIAYNLISNCDTNQGGVLYFDRDQSEIYLNTWNDVGIGGNPFAFVFWTPGDPPKGPSTVDDLDFRGNFMQNTGGVSIATSRISGWQSGHNAYAGTYDTGNTLYTSDSNKETYTEAELNMGSFSFYRKKLTGPELVTISGVVPTASTPSSFRNGTIGANIGSRTGIGIDDELY